MKKYLLIYPNTDPENDTSICRSGHSFDLENIEDGIGQACIFVPKNYPFLLVDADLYDDIFHDAYRVDFTNPDGYGENEKMLKSFLRIGFQILNR